MGAGDYATFPDLISKPLPRMQSAMHHHLAIWVAILTPLFLGAMITVMRMFSRHKPDA